MTDLVVSAFYHFARIDDPAALRNPLRQALAAEGLRGTVLLAGEGVNGTIAGTRSGIDVAMGLLRELPGCSELQHKESTASEMPFYRLKVRLKKEIVTLGLPDIDPMGYVGTYVAPKDWNALIADPNVVVIDTRNDYEVQIGTFERAVNPETATFREFPAWFEEHRQELEGKKVAMFCTGGIRCEKATAFLRQQGLDDVYHLQGGILKYLEEVPEAESRWSGECFVFDHRVAIRHGLEVGEHELCFACRRPLSAAQRRLPSYEPGVSCLYCLDERGEDQRKRYAQRQHQVDLAERRGTQHIGGDPSLRKGIGSEAE